MNTLVARIGLIDQYNPLKKTVIYNDNKDSRWTKIYGKLVEGDHGIFITTDDRILVGRFTEVVENTSIRFAEIIEIPVSNDQFLQLDEAYPEFMPQVKANFPPFIHKKQLDIKELIDSAIKKQFVSYYLIKNKDEIEVNKQTFKPNDRIIFLEGNVLSDAFKISANGLAKLDLPNGVLTAKGYSLQEILSLHKNHKEDDSNNVRRVENIISTLKSQPFYKFKSFFAYHDTVYNSRVFGKGGINEIDNDKFDTNDMNTIALNQILFGPPGTGKTYHTVNEAVKIADPDFYQSSQGNRTKLKERFRDLLIKDWKGTQGQIAFCTFHQSFSYEDFVEGIKPIKPQEGDIHVKYSVESGIFKKICQLAEENRKSNQLKDKQIISWNEEIFKKAIFYKISLGDTSNEEDISIYDYCIKNNCIALGYGGETDFSGLDESQIIKRCKELGKESFAEQAVNRFIHYLKIGNYVLISNGNRYVRAIGKVTGPYKYDPNTSIRYKHFRPVEWIVVNQDIPVTDLYDRHLSQQTIYKMDEDGIKKEFFVNNGQDANKETAPDKKFVLIIDEINRGNVSSIFGELITLIEGDKRASDRPDSEQLEVTLPYSKEPFKVPDNVYIIGTMNTADRSIEALDTALRRRFSFREIQSRPEILLTESSSKGKIGDIDLVQLLNVINQRIEKLIDKDHKIGHAYFMDDATEDALRITFHDKVIPLLQEYFFGDFGKIGLVLGNSFVEKVNDNFEFAKFEGYDPSVSADLKERPVYRISNLSNWRFQSIYE